jgi:hypothetical protein
MVLIIKIGTTWSPSQASYTAYIDNLDWYPEGRNTGLLVASIFLIIIRRSFALAYFDYLALIPFGHLADSYS